MDNLVTLQDLFKNNIFKIPDYQRGYSWENRHRRDLLEDLDSIQLAGDGGATRERKHYTGTVVLEPHGAELGFGESYQRFDIVDGQQRITSLSILLAAIIKELGGIEGPESAKVAENVRNRYISVDGPQGSIFKLTLDGENDFYFRQAVLLDKQDVELTIRSHQNLQAAKRQFADYLARSKAVLSPGDYLKELQGLIRKITQLLVFTVYTVEDNSEVGVIFEVMNDRGKPLSELEKVKNLLMYVTNRVSNDPLSSQQLINKVNVSWKDILQNLAKAQRFESEDENQFLRINAIVQFYLDLASYKNEEGQTISISSQLADVHELLKRRLKDLEKDKAGYRVRAYSAISAYVDSLRGSSFRFRDLLQPYEGFAFQNVKDNALKEELRLATARFSRMENEATMLPLNVAVYERFHEDPVTHLSLLKTMEIFAFRIYGIANLRPYTAQTTIYGLASEIYRGKRDAKDIDSELRRLAKDYVPDDALPGYLIDPKIDYYDWNSLRYFLYEYEREQTLKMKKRPYFEWEDLEKKEKEDTVEHILPQTIRADNGMVLRKYWCDRFTPESHAINLRRLGNLTLTENNSSLGNKGFDEKSLIYKGSRWEIERELTNYSDWTDSEIREREGKLVEFATSRWKA